MQENIIGLSSALIPRDRYITADGKYGVFAVDRHAAAVILSAADVAGNAAASHNEFVAAANGYAAAAIRALIVGNGTVVHIELAIST